MRRLTVEIDLGELGTYDGTLTWEVDETNAVLDIYSVHLTVKIDFVTVDMTDRIPLSQLLKYHDEIVIYEKGELLNYQDEVDKYQ